MFRRLTGLTLILTILFGVLTTASAVIGRGYDPPVVIAQLYPSQPGSIVRAADRIALFDLSRLLRVTRIIPLKAIQQTTFNYPPDGSLTVSIYEMNVPKKIYKAGLYVYNYLWGTLTDVFTAQADQAFNIASTGYFYNFFPAASSDGERIVFIHPQDQKLYLYNTETKQTSPLGDFQLGVEDRGSTPASGSDLINWSPDDSKIILKLASTLYIFNSDNGEYREYSFDTGDFYPTWSGDSQYLWLQRYSFATQNENTPIEIIDVSTGQEHPLTRDLSGTSL